MPIPLRAKAVPAARAASKNFPSTAALDPAKTQTRSIVSLPQRFAAYKDLQFRAREEERMKKAALLGAGAAALSLLVLLALRGGQPQPRDVPGPDAPASSRPAAPAAGGSTGTLPSGAVPRAGGRDRPEPHTGEGTRPLDKPATAADGFVEVRAMAAGKPQPGAQVRLYLKLLQGGELEWRAAGAAQTDGAGVARIAARRGAYLAAAHAPGLAAARKEFRRPAGEPVTRVEIQLAAGASLAGRTVAKGTSDPVPLATVTAIPLGERARFGPFGGGQRGAPEEERLQASSDERGRFRLTGLSPGRYRVEAQAPGSARAALRQIAVPHGGEVVLELPQASYIEGQVLASDGKPADEAELLASGDVEPVSGVASGTGAFSLEVSPGSWELSARRGQDAGRADGRIAVAAGQTVRGVQIRLGSGSSIEGTVTGAGHAVQGARVGLSVARASGVIGEAETDAAGAFSLRGLAPGSYDLDVSADGYAPAERRGLTVLEAQKFPVQVRLTGLGALQGTVYDAAGRSVSGALVRAGAQFQPDAQAEARADANGAYRLDGLAPGRVFVSAARDGSALGARHPVDVPEGGVAQADLSLADEGVVTGRVTRANGASPDQPVNVNAMPAGGGFMRSAGFGTVPAEVEGSYRMSLPAGTYTLSASTGSSPPRGGPRQRVFVTVEVGQTAVKDLVLAEADSQTGLTGIVLEPGGAPSPRALVTVRSASSDQRMMTVLPADDEGAFQVNRPRADLPDVIDVVAVNGGRLGRARVGPGETTLTVQLQPAASLHGRVVSAAAVSGFKMTVSLKSAQSAFFASPANQRVLEFAGDRFQADDLPADAVHVHVETQDGRTGDADATLASGQTTELEVPLQDAGNLLGRAVDESGRPIANAFVNLDGRANAGQLQVGADGRFRATGLSPGDHLLHLFAQGYQPLERNLTLAAGQSLDLGDVTLQKQRAQPGTIGAFVRGDSESVSLAFLIPDGPADRAGLRPGDELVAIDGARVQGQADATSRLRGVPGTPVSVIVRRDGTEQSFQVVRAS